MVVLILLWHFAVHNKRCSQMQILLHLSTWHMCGHTHLQMTVNPSKCPMHFFIFPLPSSSSTTSQTVKTNHVCLIPSIDRLVTLGIVWKLSMSLDFRLVKYHLNGENNIIEYTWGSEGTERCMLACNKSGRGVVYVIQLGRWGEIQLICLIDVWTLCTFLKDFVFTWNLGGGASILLLCHWVLFTVSSNHWAVLGLEPRWLVMTV